MSDFKETLAMKKFSEINQEIEEALKQPKRKWVGLTDDEVKQIGEDYARDRLVTIEEAIRYVEAVLKEKNT